MSVRAELDAIRGDDLLLHPEEVVVWAHNHPDSMLHSELEWNDTIAGHQYRVWQVRRLIAVHCVRASRERTMISLSIDRVAGGGYRNVTDVAKVPALRDVMLQDALAELNRIKAKYHYLEELAGVFAEIERVKKRTGRTIPAETTVSPPP